MIKAIIFDWHGVLDKVRSEGFFRILEAHTSLSESEIKKIYGEFDKERIVGKINQEEFTNILIKNLNIDPKIIHEAVNYVDTSDLNPEVWSILKSLKGKYKLALLTDSSDAKTEHIKNLPNLDLFDVMLFSSDEHISKRSPEFFMRMTSALDEMPEDCLFIDDKEEITEFAKRLGFQTHQFTTAEELKYFLSGI